jgi:transcriptional regulator with XRE-family HTH domain
MGCAFVSSGLGASAPERAVKLGEAGGLAAAVRLAAQPLSNRVVITKAKTKSNWFFVRSRFTVLKPPVAHSSTDTTFTRCLAKRGSFERSSIGKWGGTLPQLLHVRRTVSSMGNMFVERLQSEFEARNLANPRYSLRAFAAFLDMDHSTLSKVMKGSRRATPRQLRMMAGKLKMPTEEIAVHLTAEHVLDLSITRRQESLRHWAAEAIAVISDGLHSKIVRLCRTSGFHADSRWIASRTAASVDDVNLVLTRLLRLELIDGRWRDQTGLTAWNELEFRKLALMRIRKKAAEDQIGLQRGKLA